MLHISVGKALFEDIVTTKQKIIHKEFTNYWKKELLDVSIIDDKINYNIKKVERLKVSNGFGEEKPTLIIVCEHIQYNAQKNIFELHLGYILERKNINFTEDYKDNLIEQLLREKERLEDDMNRDHLTHVYNRRKMESDLERFIAQNNAHLLSATFVDADRFKGINDFFGHDAGDSALQYLARKLQKHAKRLNGEVYRYGGEEFILLCFIPKEMLLNGLESLRTDIKSEKLPHAKRPISLTVSMGVSFWSEIQNKTQFIKIADEGVYAAKANGRDRIEVLQPSEKL
jgi:diguanylate cyclase (GGDEF)-like protein